MAEQQLDNAVVMGINVDAPGYKPGTNYVRHKCECGKDMWLGPLGMEKKKAGVKALCMLCALKFLKGSPVVALNPNQTPQESASIDEKALKEGAEEFLKKVEED
jgi:hypothetical protein